MLQDFRPAPSKASYGISLRFAMVHDVIHERFPKHGEAYYRHRNDMAKRRLAQADATTRPSDPAWRLMDDLAVGLVHLAVASAEGTRHLERRYGDLGRAGIRRAAVADAVGLLEGAIKAG